MDQVQIIQGNSFTDHRGTLRFVNDFDFAGVKRFYCLTHPDTEVVRAWQGHKIEHKYFSVIKGKFLIAWVAIDDWEQPSVHLQPETILLSADSPCVLSIPPGYANGLKAMEPDSMLMSYSNLNIEEGNKDNWRFDGSLWLDWSKYN